MGINGVGRSVFENHPHETLPTDPWLVTAFVDKMPGSVAIVGHTLTQPEVEAFCKALNSSLDETLTIHLENVSFADDTAAELFALALTGKNNIGSIELCRCQFPSEEAAQKLSTAFSTLPNLTSFTLDEMLFDERGNVWQKVLQSPSLKTVVLSRNNGLYALDILSFQKEGCPIEEIDLSFCGNVYLDPMIAMLGNHASLKVLRLLGGDGLSKDDKDLLLATTMSINESMEVVLDIPAASPQFSYPPEMPRHDTSPQSVVDDEDPLQELFLCTAGDEDVLVRAFRDEFKEPGNQERLEGYTLAAVKDVVISSPYAVRAFFEGVAQSGCQGLYLSNVKFESGADVVFAEELQKAKRLIALQIYINNEHIYRSLGSEELKARVEVLECRCSPWNMQSVYKFLEGNTCVTCLTLNDGHFEDDTLSRVLKDATSLNKLQFQFCDFKGVVMKLLLSTLQELPLKSLLLSGNTVGDAKDLIPWKTMLSHPTLVSLDLQHNCLSDDVFRNFFWPIFKGRQPIPFDSRLQQINLSHCNLKDSGVIVHLGNAFPRLKRLLLKGNNFTNTAQIREVLKLVNVSRPDRHFNIVFNGTELFWEESLKLREFCRHVKEYDKERLSITFESKNALEESNYEGQVPTNNSVWHGVSRQKVDAEWRAQELIRKAREQASQLKADLLQAIERAPMLTQGILERTQQFVCVDNELNIQVKREAFLAMLKKMGFIKLDVKGDGTCLFHAVALGLELYSGLNPEEISEAHKQLGFEVRKSVIKYMRTHKEEFEPFFAVSDDEVAAALQKLGLLLPNYQPEDFRNLRENPEVMAMIGYQNVETFDAHLTRMENPQVFADQYEIEALVQSYSVELRIFDRTYDNYEIVDGELVGGPPVHGEGNPLTIFLVREGGHYDLLWRPEL